MLHLMSLTLILMGIVPVLFPLINILCVPLCVQDAQHREAMGSLHTADRSSLISEVRQLRAQMEQLHQGL